MLLKPSTTWRAVSRRWVNDSEPKFAKSTIGIPEVSTLLLDTEASDLEATEGRKRVLETAALAQDNMAREGRSSPYLGGRLGPQSAGSTDQ